MFKKVLIANRGEIAVRVLRTCRDLGIQTVAILDASDRGSLHIRLADECVELKSERGYLDQQAVLQIALQRGAEAIHPGYGFLAEAPDFATACEAAGVAFIGPPGQVIGDLGCKIDAMNRARAAGFATPSHSSISFGDGNLDAVYAEADRLGYPLIVKSCSGGRGRGTRCVSSPSTLENAVREARAESTRVYGDNAIYLEQAILPAHYLEVQVLADHHGHLIHLGERDGTLQCNNQKLVEESPAPCLTEEQRHRLWQMALDIARLFHYRNVGSVEFLMDEKGEFYFTEIKARIQVEHPITEMVSLVDIVREQLRIAAGERLALTQEDVKLRGWAMQCRINAEDPWNNFLPSPGYLTQFRLPGGPHVRVDTYAYSGCEIPARYDPLLANLVVWGEDRDECLGRMHRALEDFVVGGVQSNVLLHQRVLNHADFTRGEYTTEFFQHPLFDENAPEDDLRALAVAAAIAYARRNLAFRPSVPARLLSGWHRESRRLPGWE